MILQNNISRVIPQVGSGEGGVYAVLSLSYEGNSCSNRPSTQLKLHVYEIPVT